jgi:hypothetical protein
MNPNKMVIIPFTERNVDLRNQPSSAKQSNCPVRLLTLDNRLTWKKQMAKVTNKAF